MRLYYNGGKSPRLLSDDFPLLAVSALPVSTGSCTLTGLALRREEPVGWLAVATVVSLLSPALSGMSNVNNALDLLLGGVGGVRSCSAGSSSSSRRESRETGPTFELHEGE